MVPDDLDKLKKIIMHSADESSRNQEIQLLLYKWRDGGCVYNSAMIDTVYEIIKIARRGYKEENDK